MLLNLEWNSEHLVVNSKGFLSRGYVTSLSAVRYSKFHVADCLYDLVFKIRTPHMAQIPFL